MFNLAVMTRNCMWEMRGSNQGQSIGFPQFRPKNVKVLSRPDEGRSFQNSNLTLRRGGLLHTLLASVFSC
jgi:hypothetical protein